MKRILSVVVASLAFGSIASAQATQPSAETLLRAAQTSAKATNRSVMVLFHASWCGWCHKMEDVMKLPDIKPIFDRYFVVQWLVTLENKDKKALENAGADVVMEKMGGKGSGIPFFYFSDPNGKLIVNSIRPGDGPDKGGNVGCPYEPNEVAWFMEMLKKAAPKMTAEETAKVRGAFEALKKKDKGG